MHFVGSYTLSDCCICECIDDIIYYIRMISVVYCSVRTTSCNIITLKLANIRLYNIHVFNMINSLPYTLVCYCKLRLLVYRNAAQVTYIVPQ